MIRQRKVTVDVAIVTKNRPDLLFRCFTHLIANTKEPDRIIVIDSGSGLGVYHEKMEILCGLRGIQLTYVATKNVVISAARNKAFSLATSSVIAFIDDDEIVPPDWITTIRDGFSKYPSTEVLFGPKEPIYKYNYWNRIWAAIYLYEEQQKGYGYFFPAGNSCYRRSFIEDTGIHFDENIRGSTAEDWAISYTLHKMGFRARFDEKLKIRHECRTTFLGFIHQWFKYGGGSCQFALLYLIPKNTRGVPRLKEMLLILASTIKNFIVFDLMQPFVYMPGLIARNFSFSLGFLAGLSKMNHGS